MARATEIFHPQEPAPPPVLKGITLELSPAEAEVLLLLLGRTNGDSKVISYMHSALNRVIDASADHVVCYYAGNTGVWTKDNVPSEGIQ